MNIKFIVWFFALIPLCVNAFTVTEGDGLDTPFGATSTTSLDLIFLPLEDGTIHSEISLELFFCCNLIDTGESFAISYATGPLTFVGKNITPSLTPLENLSFEISDIFINSQNLAQVNISPSVLGNGVFVSNIKLSVIAVPLPTSILLFLNSLLLICVPKRVTRNCTGLKKRTMK